METVGDLFGSAPRITAVLPAQWPPPDPLWFDYDAATDSMLVYLTGKPVRGVHVWVEDDVYLVVGPVTKQMVGLYVEAWERTFLPAHPGAAHTRRE